MRGADEAEGVGRNVHRHFLHATREAIVSGQVVSHWVQWDEDFTLDQALSAFAILKDSPGTPMPK
jgi:hypothetical protein